jgi:hypothetical protein
VKKAYLVQLRCTDAGSSATGYQASDRKKDIQLVRILLTFQETTTLVAATLDN